MKKFLLLLLFCQELYAQTAITKNDLNFTSFSAEKKVVTPELQSLTDKQFYKHPEYGILPYNAPCTDCVELLQKRDETHRYFVKNGSQGKVFYQQSSYGAQSFFDQNHILRTIDNRLKPTAGKNVFAATQQPFPITIDLNNHFSSITNGNATLVFNKDLKVYLLSSNHEVKYLGTPSYQHYTAGDHGVLITDFLPGIDLSMQAGEGKIETNFIIKQRLSSDSNGWLVITDAMQVPDNLTFDYGYSEKDENDFYKGTLALNDNDGHPNFIIDRAIAYDAASETATSQVLSYSVGSDKAYNIYIPLQWLNNKNRLYPVTIDPIVSAMSILPKASITGSGYSDTCFANGCSYELSVAVPACTITDIQYSFDYEGFGPCTMNKGAFDLTYGSCRSPNSHIEWISCPNPFAGLCEDDNLSCFADFQSCIPPSQCSAYNMNIIMNFYRCVNMPDTVVPICSSACILAASPWSVTVIGTTPDAYPVADFSISADSALSHHYLITDNSTGTPPISYDWNWGDGTRDDTIPYPSHTYIDSGFYNICLSITDSTGCTSIFCDSSFHALRTTNTMVYVSVLNPFVTGTNQLSIGKSQIKISPNPATTQLTIQASSGNQRTATVSIINMLGQTMLSSPSLLWKGSEVLDISNLPPGVYFVKLQDESNIWECELVKE